MVLEQPEAIYAAHSIPDVVPLLNRIEGAAQSGAWVAVLLSYEAGPAFDSALTAHNPTDVPLVWAAVFQTSLPAFGGHTHQVADRPTAWEPQITRREYNEAIKRIHELIAAGQTYQVNYTFPLYSSFRGDPEALYHSLCAAQRADYSAYLDLGRYKVLSLSPELFFERQGDLVRAKPMKGTSKRGRWAGEDEEMAHSLATSTKDRAENVMIVDLIRNDLGKVAVPGQVRVSRLYDVEQYPTLWQMTSTVEAVLRPGIRLVDLLTALFPCGSVTGAPKVSTMRIISELEPFPRQIYTGTIGIIRPGGDCIFNVAIRTLLIDSTSERVTFGVGGGVTIDSTADREYDECVLKASFLTKVEPEYQLLETLLLEEGDLFLVDRHLKRLTASARYFGFPFKVNDVNERLEDVKRRHPLGRWKVRLLVSKDGSSQTEVQALGAEDSSPVRTALSEQPIQSTDPFLFHKTTNRSLYERAKASRPDCDEVILWNEDGEITEATVANVVVRQGKSLFTPPLSSGLLPGVFREELLATGTIRECVIRVDEFWAAEEVFLINSVQKWRRAVSCEQTRRSGHRDRVDWVDWVD